MYQLITTAFTNIREPMWSYKYTSSSSIFVDQCRVGIRLQASTPVTQLVELFTAVSKEQVISSMMDREYARFVACLLDLPQLQCTSKFCKFQADLCCYH